MRVLKSIAPLLAVFGLVTVTSAGVRGPGKYCGVVVYDRWDGCTLSSGIYVMYISEGVKAKLRAHAGRSIQIDAKEVVQLSNPGDGLIKALDYVGKAPAADNSPSGDGLRIHAASAFEDGETPVVVVTIENVSVRDQHVGSRELAPTLLTRKQPGPDAFIPADGPSFAAITRLPFWSDGPLTRGGAGHDRRSYAWQIDEPLPEAFVLGPSDTRRIRLAFDLPEGEYDFLVGYGGGTHAGRGLASNLVAFDVRQGGKAATVRVKGR